jgi:nucleotide-binding universal stress UspA family protein
MDRSSASARALQYALALVARGKAARLVIVHVLEDVSAEEPRFAEHFNVVECWREIAPEIRATYEALVPPDTRASCNVEVRVPFGKAYRELLDVARDVESDLIVIGAAGRETPFGATTQHVLRAADCPVLIVPGA